ncbi:cadherin-23 isoform X2 [Tribolium castaneum]|uniref:cadherin-23 isoform X2 n=1 Tax=Tribolium castaneum TaxID=7070 RepID=UPI00077DACC4|nr:PREDICTED: cadherin-23 isoform X2 [Tribolium castaneum]|eukprot:XP_015840656.1 PREDICTED: cadherin-23 isoform X2 [Tribolium castaneum]
MDQKTNKYVRTFSGHFVKVRFKQTNLLFVCVIVVCVINSVQCNRPPRFLINGQTEIVLRLKEGKETPVGTLIYKLRGTDPDGDPLSFGVRSQSGSDVIRVENISPTEADVYLNKELDRETRDEYPLVLTLTDGRLGHGNYVTQSLLLLVEDVNDNTPIFTSHQSSITLREDAAPGVIATLEATDLDEGAYGQVVYQLQEVDTKESLFSVSTAGGKAIVRLVGSLDYEKQTLHQLKVLAVDRAKQGRVNTGTAALLVKVEDVEDQPPEFVRVTSVARIAENAPIGTSVLQVTAIDGDRGVNNPILYSLSSNSIDRITDVFSLEETTGTLLTAKTLDRESLSLSSGTYILQITATEYGGKIKPPPSVTTEVTVIITDINDETPKFRSGYYECEIAENAPVNTPLTFLGSAMPEVYDHDQGINGTFQLYVKGASDVFEITPTKAINEATFMIRVKNSTFLDYEKIKTINFTLVAKEIVKHNPKFNEVPVVAHILDRNDNYPEFTKNVYEVFVPENCDIGATVAWVQALDDDSGVFGTMGIRYTHLSGSIQHMLNLHPTTGIISVKTAGGPNWDREQISRHYLTVEARDDLGQGNRITVQLIINIEDVNDNPPIFTQNRYEARLLENKLDFENPLKVEARDADLNGTKNNEIEYSLFGDLSHNFTIEPSTGIIKPRTSIDFEALEGSLKDSIRQLHLTVRARDWGTPSLFSDVPLYIYVQDVNDHAPLFEYTFYNKSVPEDISGGTSILQVRAKDFDGSSPNNRIVYRIQNGASDKFIIAPESGIISVARGASLDPDLTQPRTLHYSLNVVALDGAPGENQLQAGVTVNVTILDINNKNPVFYEPGSVTMRENTAVGSVIAKLKAKDLDKTAQLVYTINPKFCEAKNERGILLKLSDFNCAETFHLHPMSGVLTIAQQLDREMVEKVQMGLMVEDTASETGPQISTTTITINIEDINDNSPKFRQPYYKFSITENSKNGVTIGNVLAEDADKNKTITYTLDGRFEITELIYLDSNSGDLVVANKIDHEIYDWLNLTIKATDSGIPARFSRVEIFIQILDENDNNPFFLGEPQSLLISEDTPVGRQVAIIEAKDADSGEFGKITYLLDRISSEGKFSIDADSGILKVSDKLDREEKHSYLLVIEAWDNYQYGFNSGESRNAFKHINVTILDVNDNHPQLHVPPYCVNITEFHEPGQAITTFHASDADDPNTSNGQVNTHSTIFMFHNTVIQVIIDISDGNQKNFFALSQISEWSAELRTTTSLRGRHGNYTLIIRAQDLGTPSHLIEEPLHICVTDFNDHPPTFVTPPHNSTLRVPENATIGSALVKIIATDEDVGSNGIVRYRLKADPAGHWKSFNLQPVSGILELRLPLDRKKQKVYDIRIEAYDLGVPSLSSDLDLTVYVSNINDYQPQFMGDEFTVNFTENKPSEVERQKLPQTVDRDELEFDGPFAPICYFIVGGNENGLFKLHPVEHILTVSRPLDREEKDTHLLLVKATEDCTKPPRNESFFDSSDDTQLKVIVKVLDVNDNAPQFIHRVFTGGVSTATSFGTTFMEVKAEDADLDDNARMSYFLIGKVQMTLTEGLEDLKRDPFLVDRDTGAVQLNFDPQEGMKGYFDFMVLVNDTGGLQDMARVFIYLLRADQRVRFVLRQQPPELRNKIEAFREILGNVTGAIVNVDEFRVHANHDGSVDKTRTDLYLHLVDRRDNSIIEVDEVLRLVDQNTEKLDELFKEFNVLDTQPGGPLALKAAKSANTTFWLTAATLFLLLLLLLCLALCINQRQTYHRKLKAATATAYDSDIDGRGLSALSGRVPNTNKHSMEGSNPIWMQAYENEWYKNADEFSQNSEHDSLDENVVSCGDLPQCNNLQHTNGHIRAQNVYQTLPPALPRRKLETTEL